MQRFTNIDPFKRCKKSLSPIGLTSTEVINFNRPIIAEAKLDGARYRVIKNEDSFSIISKRISTVTGEYVDKTDNFPQLGYFREYTGNLDFEVEMTVNEGKNTNVSMVTEISGSSPERAVAKQKEVGFLTGIIIDVHYMGISDKSDPTFRGLKTTPETWEDIRNCSLAIWEWASYKVGDSAYISLPEFIPVHNIEEVEKAFKNFVLEGYEGTILKDNFGNWIKIKKLDTWDYIITGFEDSNSLDFKSKGWIGSIKIGYCSNIFLPESICKGIEKERYTIIDGDLYLKLCDGRFSKIITVGTCGGFDFDVRSKFSENPESYIGRVIEVSGQELTKSLGVRHPRFIRFHEDKSFHEITEDSLTRRVGNNEK